MFLLGLFLFAFGYGYFRHHEPEFRSVGWFGSAIAAGAGGALAVVGVVDYVVGLVAG